MDRKSKILANALSTEDGNILYNLQIPKYESTKGLNTQEINILLNCQSVFCTHADNEVDDQLSESPNEDSGSEYLPETDSDNDSDNMLTTDDLDIELEVQELGSNKRLSESMTSDSDIEIEMQKPLNVTQSVILSEEKVENTRKKRNKRLWNKKDYCFFCETDVLKISRHLLRNHPYETEVQQILSYKVGDKRRKYFFNKIRNKGNFLKSTTEEHIVPVRKPLELISEIPNTSTYLPCKFCKGFYKKEFLYRHVKKCPHNSDDKSKRINAQAEGQSLFAAYKNNDMLRKEIFPMMRADEISLAAKTDPLICSVARRYLKSHRDKQFRLVASRKMRQLASLLIEIRKKIKCKSLLEALDPTNFETIVNCTKIISRFDPETETYGAPSLASNMGTQLKDCIDVAYSLTLKQHHTETDTTIKLKLLKELITTEWRYEISTIANSDLQQKKWNKPTLIPLAEDLTLLKGYLLKESEKLRNELHRNPQDERTFKTLQEICYVQLLLLNRRRVGELQRMTVVSYSENITNQNSKEFENCISENERVLMRSFKRVIIKGKRGRGVPVLFTEDMVRSINLLLQVRERFITQKNIYLFANIKSSTSISGTKAMYKHVRLAGVNNAAALTSTKLRKHLATMSQVINLSEQDLEQLANFMGHTKEIHKSFYRLPNDVYQMAKVSKLLLLNERGEASKYKGKTLDEIDINLDVIEEDNSDDDIQDDEQICILPDIVHEKKGRMERKASEVQKKELPGPSQKKRILEPWTEKQKNVTLEYFKKHLKKKIPPKKHECLQLKKDNEQLLKNKTWEKVKIFIVNNYVKK